MDKLVTLLLLAGAVLGALEVIRRALVVPLLAAARAARDWCTRFSEQLDKLDALPDVGGLTRQLAKTGEQLHELAGSFMAYSVHAEVAEAALVERLNRLQTDVDVAHRRLREVTARVATLEPAGAS